MTNDFLKKSKIKGTSRASKKLISLVVGRGSSGDLCGVLQDRM